jgi:hypothetical protein
MPGGRVEPTWKPRAPRRQSRAVSQELRIAVVAVDSRLSTANQSHRLRSSTHPARLSFPIEARAPIRLPTSCARGRGPRLGEGPRPLGQREICERIGTPGAGLVAGPRDAVRRPGAWRLGVRWNDPERTVPGTDSTRPPGTRPARDQRVAVAVERVFGIARFTRGPACGRNARRRWSPKLEKSF